MQLPNGGQNVLSWAGGLFLLTMGVLAIVNPGSMIRWAASAHPNREVDEKNPFSIWLVRFIGICMFGFGLLVLLYA